MTRSHEVVIADLDIVYFTDIRAQELPRVGRPRRNGKFYAKITLGSDGEGKSPATKQTEVSKRTSSPAWEDTLY